MSERRGLEWHGSLNRHSFLFCTSTIPFKASGWNGGIWIPTFCFLFRIFYRSILAECIFPKEWSVMAEPLVNLISMILRTPPQSLLNASHFAQKRFYVFQQNFPKTNKIYGLRFRIALWPEISRRLPWTADIFCFNLPILILFERHLNCSAYELQIVSFLGTNDKLNVTCLKLLCTKNTCNKSGLSIFRNLRFPGTKNKTWTKILI